MILYLFLWFGSSIIISLLLARIIGKGRGMILDDEDSFEYGDWFIENTTTRQTFLDGNQYKVLTNLGSDDHVRNRDRMKVNLN